MTIRDFSSSDCWRALILYGLNTATYKIALGKTLLQFAESQRTEISWGDLSRAFFVEYRDRIESNGGMPQSGLAGRQTTMERIVAEFRTGRATEATAIAAVGDQAFGDVIPRFHNLGREQGLQGKFYEVDFGRRLVLKDALLDVASDSEALNEDIEARWSLLEGAYSIQAGDFQLANDIRDIYIVSGYDRRNLTKNIPFLRGYQGNQCFYCGEPILGSVHVDHVLPRQVLQHDDIWNLVLAHDFCNLQKEDRLVGEHFVRKLIARNENIMGSNHPWKKKIAEALGGSSSRRARSTLEHYKNVATVLGWNFWNGDAGYNPEADPFYSRLITVLNNKKMR